MDGGPSIDQVYKPRLYPCWVGHRYCMHPVIASTMNYARTHMTAAPSPRMPWRKVPSAAMTPTRMPFWVLSICHFHTWTIHDARGSTSPCHSSLSGVARIYRIRTLPGGAHVSTRSSFTALSARKSSHLPRHVPIGRRPGPACHSRRLELRRYFAPWMQALGSHDVGGCGQDQGG